MQGYVDAQALRSTVAGRPVFGWSLMSSERTVQKSARALSPTFGKDARP